MANYHGKNRDQYFIDKFMAQKKMLKSEMIEHEEFKQCIDQKSFKGAYYYPQWVVTKKGRVWSVEYAKWLMPHYSTKDKDGYWKVGIDCQDGAITSPKISQLVANYFCDKTVIDLYGEAHVQVHHIIDPVIPDELKVPTKDNQEIAEKRRLSAMYFDCADNLRYQLDTDHSVITNIMRGMVSAQMKPHDEEDGTIVQEIGFDAQMLYIFDKIKTDEDFRRHTGFYFEYDKNGATKFYYHHVTNIPFVDY